MNIAHSGQSLLLGLLFAAGVQTAPAQPTEPDRFFNPWPETGAWSAMDDSKTGFYFEIQDGILAGARFGFDDHGNNVWLIFSGQLQPREGSSGSGSPVQDGWRLEAELFQTLDGGCILDCEPGHGGGVPIGEAVGRIVIEFSGRSEATFQVDGGDRVPIIPLYFGNAAFAFDPEQPLRFLPNLAGTWVAARSDAPEPEAPPCPCAAVVEIGEMEMSQMPAGRPGPGQDFLSVRFPILDPGAFTAWENTEIVCSYRRGAMDNPFCEIPQIGSPFFSTLSGDEMTDTRFTLFILSDTNQNATRFEFFRLDYD